MLSKRTFPQTERRLSLQLKTPDFSTRQYFPGNDQQLYCRERQRKQVDMRQTLCGLVFTTPLQFLPGKMRLCPQLLFVNGFHNPHPTNICLEARCHHLIQQKKDLTLISRILNFFFIQVIFAGTFKCQADTF